MKVKVQLMVAGKLFDEIVNAANYADAQQVALAKKSKCNYCFYNSSILVMTPEEKELRAIARFYKDSKAGFATNDGFYAIPCGGKR